MAMPITPDVIIIGGGVIGCATAYFLGASHQVRCLVLERDGIGSQASGGAAGELSPIAVSPIPPAFTDLCLEGLRLHRELAPTLTVESGVDYHLSDIPVFRPAFTDEEVREQRELVEWHRERGLDATWLDGPALRSLDTWLPEDTLGAAYLEREAQLESYALVLALAQAAERHGAAIRTVEVTGLQRQGERVSGVLTADGPLACDSMVLAAGPWSQSAQEWLELPVPVVPLRGQIVHLAVPSPLPEYGIFHPSGYVLPKASGKLLAGTTAELAGFAREPTPEGTASILEAAYRLAPSLADAQVVEVTACLRPLSLDGLPLIGPAPGFEGLFIATGHGRKGIVAGLATGKYLAQLIAQGRSEYPLDPFSPERLVTGPTHAT